MWRYLVGAGAALALAGAGMMAFGGQTTQRALLPPAPAAAPVGEQDVDVQTLPDRVPAASAKTREERRFGRYDKDRDGAITRDEYLAQRRKAYAKLDTNGDGRLSFDEWAIKATTKFGGADRDKSGAMSATEFATTAVKRKPRARVNCPPVQAAPAEEEG
ncbi:MAG: histidine kinase [Sphingomonas bacterium]|uniref:EF-hand domain-containing protein n=1 Tax=Sphingomonas bacterium TaxID=1895847 RepID=UPI00261295C3|nr:EF-hand domain-containing protein [Sphingomonas bacterium]MDB5695533.1 histidine kinase [Sphingomonas bacterium]